MATSTKIGAYEAKTHLPDLLRKVQAGQHFTITRRGRPVAELTPIRTANSRGRLHAAGCMKAFMKQAQPFCVDTKAMSEEGRD